LREQKTNQDRQLKFPWEPQDYPQEVDENTLKRLIELCFKMLAGYRSKPKADQLLPGDEYE
jgi:hypothetical protein